jgi:hypothetical protein
MDNKLVLNKILNEVDSYYNKDKQQKSFNLLLLGEAGTGKTYLLRTARKPIYIFSFDPGGPVCIEDEIEKGEIYVDNKYEKEDVMNPTAYVDFKRRLNVFLKSGISRNFGTVVLDSSTFFADAVMNKILFDDKRAGEEPKWGSDYNKHKVMIRNTLKDFLRLEADCIVTGHLKLIQDDRRVIYRYATTGEGVREIPAMFGEIWIMSPLETKDGMKYRILTQSEGTYSCRSRLSKGGILKKYEDANLKKILKKTKFQFKDKEEIKLNPKTENNKE